MRSNELRVYQLIHEYMWSDLQARATVVFEDS